METEFQPDVVIVPQHGKERKKRATSPIVEIESPTKRETELSPVVRVSPKLESKIEKEKSPRVDISPKLESQTRKEKSPKIEISPKLESQTRKEKSPKIERSPKLEYQAKKERSPKEEESSNLDSHEHSRHRSKKKKKKKKKIKVQPENKDLSRKPTCTRFHQQKLKGWTPCFEPRFISRVFIGMSMSFLIIGCITIILTLGIDDISIDYTKCTDPDGIQCSEKINNVSYTNEYSYCQCNYSFVIRRLLKAPIYFYYSLGNYYQNHRTFLDSRDDKQLHGDDLKKLQIECEPLRYKDKAMLLKYAPCGMVANAKFNDTFQLVRLSGNYTTVVIWSDNNIAWKSDKNIIFGHPKNWNNTVKPVNWKLTAFETNPKAYSGDEDFVIWMKTAPLQYFRKLHRIINTGPHPFEIGLPKGNYTLMINYAYPVAKFFGTKSVYFSTTTFLGGKNICMSLLFLIEGAVLFLLGMLLIYYEKYNDPTVTQHPVLPLSKGYLKISTLT